MSHDPKYPFLEYLYTGDHLSSAMLGSAIRAIGKGWNIAGIGLIGDQWLRLQKALNTPLLDLYETSEAYLHANGDHQLVLVGQLDEDAFTTLRTHPHVLGKRHVMAAGSFSPENFDLISDFHSQASSGTIQAFTGAGKGKTTSALGWAWSQTVDQDAEHATDHPPRVAVIQWFKERSNGRLTWAINEHAFPLQLKQPQLWSFHPTGAGFFGSPALDRVAGEEAARVHRQKALDGLRLAEQLLSDRTVEILVLDELVDTLQEVMPSLPAPLLFLPEVTQLLEKCEKAGVVAVLTGRKVPQELVRYLKTSTVVDSLRHPWADQKRGAVSGLDY